MSRRTEMLGSTIQRELAEFVMRELNDPRLPMIVSITRVKVSEDLDYADVYVSVMGTPGQQNAALIALRHSAGLMRTRLTKALSIRQAPFIRFSLDEQLKKELEILDVLDRLRIEREEGEARKKAAAEAEAGGTSADTPAGGDAAAGGAAAPDQAATDQASTKEQKDEVDGADPSEQQSPT
jgi:ribosome-binding factor A